jgi:hypothetical protein
MIIISDHAHSHLCQRIANLFNVSLRDKNLQFYISKVIHENLHSLRKKPDNDCQAFRERN